MGYRGLQVLIFSAIVGAALSLPAISAEKATKNEAGLRATELGRYKAMIDKDVETVRLALADELAYVHSSGVRQSKEEHLYDLGHTAVYRKIDVKEMEVKIYGNVGVINGLADFASGPGDAPASPLRYLDVYVWRDGRWQMVSFHCTRPNQGGGRGAPPGAGGPPGVGGRGASGPGAGAVPGNPSF